MPGICFSRNLGERRKNYMLVEVWMGCSNDDVRIRNNNDIKLNKKKLLQWKQYIATMLVLHIL